MSFEYTQIEDDVVSRLTGKINSLIPQAGYKVRHMPEKEAAFEISLNNCLILVAYADSIFDTPSATDFTRQNEIVSVVVNIKSPKLRGNFSIHEAVRLVKLVLLGYKPNNCGKMYLEKIELDERDEKRNFFSYNMVFKCSKLNIEVDEETVLPNLILLTFNTEYEAPNLT